MGKDSNIPAPTIERLAFYSRPLETLIESGIPVISSEKLAKMCGVNPAQVRKDLGYFGEFGVRGVGYNIRDLLREIKKILSTDKEWSVCIVGIGHLARALLEDENFRKRGYRFVAAFDSDMNKVGLTLPSGLAIEPIKKISEIVAKTGAQIGIIATPSHEAQRAADLLMDAGIQAILNFASIQVRTRECCSLENVDFTVKLENLAYHLGKIK